MKAKTDFLFTLLLFLLFAVSALGLILTGAGVYERTVNSMEDNFEERTALSYVAEKLRQNDGAGTVFAEDDMLRICTKDQDGSYTLYIYEYEGYLTELFARDSLPFDPAAGQKLLKIQGFSVTEQENGLLSICVSGREEDSSLLLQLRADQP